MRILLKYRILILLIDILEFDMKKNIKKKKIKVPAAQFGLGNMPQLQSSITTGLAPNDPSYLQQAFPTQGGSKLMGSLNVAGIAQALPGAINTLTSPFQTSTATTGKEATMQSITGIAEGIGAGAQLGSAIGGPVGSIVGGAAGAVTGLIGKKGKKAGMTSFTDYDEGTLGTGLIGAFKNKKLRRHRAAVKNNAYLNRQAVVGTENLANQWNEENADYDTNTFEYGGSNPVSLAYVDDGELISTPDGTVSKVPEKGQPTDSNLVNLPEGSKVLSNTLKVPGTNKTFAQLGEQIMAKNKNRNNDRFAQNSAKLNEMNNKQIHDKLFTMQETLKDKKGVKPKTKALIPAAETGLKTGKDDNRSPLYNAAGFMTDPRFAGEISMAPIYPSPKYRNTSVRGDVTAPWDTYGKASEINAGILPEVTITADRKTKPVTTGSVSRKIATKPVSKTLPDDYVENIYENWTPSKIYAKPQNKDATNLLMTPQEVQADIQRRQEWENAARPEDRGNFDFGELASGIASLAPIMSNLFTSSPESVQANYNPYASAITNTMGRRRYNIDPLIRDIDTNRAVADYGASQQMTNTGHNMAFRLQNAIQANKAKASARAAESNANNQYKAEYANAMNDLGQQWVKATNLASDLNAQNRASVRNIRRTGLGQLSQWAQNRTLMRNQSKKDKAMMKLYEPFLQAGFAEDVIRNWKKYLN